MIMLETLGKVSAQELRLTVKQNTNFQYHNLWAKNSMLVPWAIKVHTKHKGPGFHHDRCVIVQMAAFGFVIICSDV